MPDVEECRVLEVCRLLLYAKADILFSIRGRTPLSYAVNRGRVDVCRLLLHEKADVSTDLYSPFPCMHLGNLLLISCSV